MEVFCLRPPHPGEWLPHCCRGLCRESRLAGSSAQAWAAALSRGLGQLLGGQHLGILLSLVTGLT